MGLMPRAVITNMEFDYVDNKKLPAKLRYFERREQANEHLSQVDPKGDKIQRWIDRGLGENRREILKNLRATQTSGYKKNVLAHRLVVSPAINFMQAIPPEKQIEILEEFTETTVNLWFEKRDLAVPEFSYIVHLAKSSSTRPEGQEKDAEGQQPYLHSHVMMAASVPGPLNFREDYRNDREDLQKLHEAGREAMERIWTRELGPERVQELNRELEEMTRLHQELDASREIELLDKDLSENELAKPLPETEVQASQEMPEIMNQQIDESLVQEEFVLEGANQNQHLLGQEEAKNLAENMEIQQDDGLEISAVAGFTPDYSAEQSLAESLDLEDEAAPRSLSGHKDFEPERGSQATLEQALSALEDAHQDERDAAFAKFYELLEKSLEGVVPRPLGYYAQQEVLQEDSEPERSTQATTAQEPEKVVSEGPSKELEIGPDTDLAEILKMLNEEAQDKGPSIPSQAMPAAAPELSKGESTEDLSKDTALENDKIQQAQSPLEDLLKEFEEATAERDDDLPDFDRDLGDDFPDR